MCASVKHSCRSVSKMSAVGPPKYRFEVVMKHPYNKRRWRTA